MDGGRDLQLSFRVDGITWQAGSTSDMLFTPGELVSYCSHFLTLRPGDVILTGTPGTTPAASDLQPGSLLETAVEGLGVSINPTTAEPGEH